LLRSADLHGVVIAVLVAVEGAGVLSLPAVITPVDVGGPGDRILLVVLVLVAALDQVLFGLLETKGPNEAIPVLRNVYVGHVARSQVVAAFAHIRRDRVATCVRLALL